MLKKSLLILSFAVAIPAAIRAQAFEGTIEFKQYTAKDTTNNLFFIKGDKVRLDQFGKATNKAEGSNLIDLTAKTITMLSHSRKMFTSVVVNKNPAGNKIDTVIKLKETKMLQGLKCIGYTVRSKSDNTEITYWLANGNFNFFDPFVVLWNRKDKASVYYRSLKDTKGMMPMLSVETDLSGHNTGKMEVTKIEKKALTANTFEIPKEYKKYE
jgi:hypothetical protein